MTENEVDTVTRRVFDDLANRMASRMNQRGVAYRFRDSRAIVFSYLNYREKFVLPIPRRVRYSKELRSKLRTFDSEVQRNISYFEKQFSMGSDINGHLSKQLYSAQKEDMLLNTWNIKHLHLDPTPANSRAEMSKNRSGMLLFFVVSGTDVCFLDVLRHPKGAGFSSFHFLEIAARNNWMSHLGFMEMKGVLELINKVTNDEDIYALLHQSKLNLSFELYGTCYMSMGISTAGNKMSHTGIVNELYRSLRRAVAENYAVFDRQYLGVRELASGQWYAMLGSAIGPVPFHLASL